ncbi:MAG: ferrous iron transport protein A [Bacteroidetes bacterium]|nr:ferrous iron transport protein A [Bacteroidota bacterium]
MKTLAQLKQGEKAVINQITEQSLERKLIDLGCVPGEKVQLSKTAPLGCPLAITISGFELSLRKDEAAYIIVDSIA